MMSLAVEERPTKRMLLNEKNDNDQQITEKQNTQKAKSTTSQQLLQQYCQQLGATNRVALMETRPSKKAAHGSDSTSNQTGQCIKSIQHRE
jgi:hypothetical protein